MIVACLSLRAGADQKRTLYQYVDDQGTIVFVDSLEKVPADQRKNVKERHYIERRQTVIDQVSQKIEERQEKNQTKKNRNPTIVIYETAWCGYCKKLKRDLNAMGFSYQTKDIEKDSNAKREFKHKFGRGGVPISEIDGQVVRGYNIKRVKELLKPYRR